MKKTYSKEHLEALQKKIVQADPSVNINVIMDRYSKTGLLPLVDATKAKYGDFTQGTSYKDALILKRDADDAFMQLPARVREKFNNDVQQMIDFLSDPKNDDEAIKLGMKKKPVKTSDELMLESLNAINQTLTEQSKT